MTMTERSASALVDVLLRAYPTYPADSATRQLYEHALVNDKHDEAVATAAVQSWIVNTAMMPKINELLDAIRVESHARRVDDSERRRIAGALPAGVVPKRSEAAALRIKLIRQVHGEMRLTTEQRLRMSVEQRDDYASRFTARLNVLVSEHADELVMDEPLETFACVTCMDTGWVDESLVEGETRLRPCVCRPDAYDRWRAGHFEPGHDCASCAALRRGRRG